MPSMNRLRFIPFWITLAIMILLILAQLGYFGSYLKHEALTKGGLPPDSNMVTVSPPVAQKKGITLKQRHVSKKKPENQKVDPKKVAPIKSKIKERKIEGLKRWIVITDADLGH